MIGTYIVVNGPRLKFCLQNFKLRDLKLQAHTTWSATSIMFIFLSLKKERKKNQ